MKKYINGQYIEMTAEEVAAIKAEAEAAEREHWLGDYDSLVDEEIRKRYTVSQEFAILRQRDEKPTEYAAYYAYCEECKAFVKAQRAKYE
jgi:hypothetical protein